MTDSESERRLFQRDDVEPPGVYQSRSTTMFQLDPVLVVM